MQINDCIRYALGDEGQINDLLIKFYHGAGAVSGQINDAEYEYLVIQGATPAALNDMWFQVLRTAGFLGSLSDMLYQFWCDAAPVTPPYFLFTNASVIDFSGISFDPSVPHAVHYTMERTDAGTGNTDLWGTPDGLNYGRLRDLDFRSFRGGVGTNLTLITFARNILYNCEEIILVPGTITISFQPVGGGPVLQQTSSAIGATGISPDFQIGQRTGGLAFQGRISDFKLYEEGTLIHHWPINEGAGTVINDLVGGINGVLTPGLGTWVNP